MERVPRGARRDGCRSARPHHDVDLGRALQPRHRTAKERLGVKASDERRSTIAMGATRPLAVPNRGWTNAATAHARGATNDLGTRGRPLGRGPSISAPPARGRGFSRPNMSQTQIIANSHRVFGHLAFLGQPAKCEVAHISFPFSPSKVQHGDIYLARQEGTHGTKTKTS